MTYVIEYHFNVNAAILFNLIKTDPFLLRSRAVTKRHFKYFLNTAFMMCLLGKFLIGNLHNGFWKYFGQLESIFWPPAKMPVSVHLAERKPLNVSSAQCNSTQ